MCRCADRREIISRAAAALIRRDAASVRAESSAFVRTIADDARDAAARLTAARARLIRR